MEAPVKPKDLIRTPPPAATPPQYIPLDLINGAIEDRYVTRSPNGVVQVWTAEPNGQYPAHDRDFTIAALEEAVAWLGRKESKQPDAEWEVAGLGRFMWQDDEIMLWMPCGDDYSFDLAALRLFVRAFNRLEESDAEPVIA